MLAIASETSRLIYESSNKIVIPCYDTGSLDFSTIFFVIPTEAEGSYSVPKQVKELLCWNKTPVASLE
jgi:hypothetical protein